MNTTRHLDDEHMRLYEWSGAGTGMPHALPAGSKRSHPWHASYGVLAVLTTLLILGCDNKGPAEQTGEQVGEAVEDMKSEAGNPAEDATPPSDPAQEGAPDETRTEAGEDTQKP
jgi:hypothetical protein